MARRRRTSGGRVRATTSAAPPRAGITSTSSSPSSRPPRERRSRSGSSRCGTSSGTGTTRSSGHQRRRLDYRRFRRSTATRRARRAQPQRISCLGGFGNGITGTAASFAAGTRDLTGSTAIYPERAFLPTITTCRPSPGTGVLRFSLLHRRRARPSRMVHRRRQGDGHAPGGEHRRSTRRTSSAVGTSPVCSTAAAGGRAPRPRPARSRGSTSAAAANPRPTTATTWRCATGRGST